MGFQSEFERFAQKMRTRAQTGKNEIMKYVAELGKSEIAEIKSTLTQLQIVEAELLQQISLAEELIANKDRKPVEEKGTTGSKAKHTLRFPFNGELWFDEVTEYKIDISKGCHAGSKSL